MINSATMNSKSSRERTHDIVSGATHLVAAILSIFGIYVLTLMATRYGTIKYWISFEVFGISMLLLYLASTVYHFLPATHHTSLFFKRVDHMMIYIFIAGSSTPIALLGVGGSIGLAIVIGVWICALLGCLTKIYWIHAPRWFSTLLYVLMGWAFGFVAVPLTRRFSPEAFQWLLYGGLCYTVGAIVYACKKPNLIPRWFGFHELFHLFVMAGSFCHFWTVLQYVK